MLEEIEDFLLPEQQFEPQPQRFISITVRVENAISNGINARDGARPSNPFLSPLLVPWQRDVVY
jgi:hypothetical protein